MGKGAGKGRAIYERDWDWEAWFFKDPKGIAVSVTTLLGILYMVWSLTRPEFRAEPSGPHVLIKFVVPMVAKANRKALKSLFSQKMAESLDIKQHQVDVLGMKSFESDGMTPMTGLLVALSVKDAAEEGALATKLLAALENPHSKLHLAMPKCPEARQQAKGCEWDGKNVFVNYGYNPEIKGGGKGGDEKPLEAGMKAGGGAAMVGESGHTMVGSEPMKVSLGAAYRRPVVIAGIPALNEACAKASAAQVAAQGSECDEFVVRVDVEGGMKDGKFDSFTMFLEEPLCRDGKHAKVQVPWIVVEAGSYHDDEGDIIAAGAVDVTGSGWAPVAFPLDGFEDDDVTLLTQVMTARDRGKAPTKDPSSPRGWYLKTKQRNLRDHGFEVAIEVDTDRQPNGGSRWDASNEAAGADATLHETVGYLATMKGPGKLSGAPFEAGRVADVRGALPWQQLAGAKNTIMGWAHFEVVFEASFQQGEAVLLFGSISHADETLAHPTLKASMRGTDAAVGAAFYLEQNRCLPPDVHPISGEHHKTIDVVSWFAIHPHRDDGFSAYKRKDCAGVAEGPNLIDMCGVCDPDPNNDCVQDCAGSWGGTREACRGQCMDVAVSCSGAGNLFGVDVKHAVVFLLVAGVGYVAWKKRQEGAKGFTSLPTTSRGDAVASASEKRPMVGFGSG